MSDQNVERTTGLAGATSVGGGILALAGVAFALTGPGALAAFGRQKHGKEDRYGFKPSRVGGWGILWNYPSNTAIAVA